MTIDDQGYAEKSFDKNIIYPDFSYSREYKNTKSGTYVTGFYFDGMLEDKVGFDMGSFSTPLLANIRKTGTYLATVKFGKKTVKAIIFCYYDTDGKQMKGRILDLNDIWMIETIIDNLKKDKLFTHTKIGGYSADTYLKSTHPEVYKIITKHYN